MYVAVFLYPQYGNYKWKKPGKLGQAKLSGPRFAIAPFTVSSPCHRSLTPIYIRASIESPYPPESLPDIFNFHHTSSLFRHPSFTLPYMTLQGKTPVLSFSLHAYVFSSTLPPPLLHDKLHTPHPSLPFPHLSLIVNLLRHNPILWFSLHILAFYFSGHPSGFHPPLSLSSSSASSLRLMPFLSCFPSVSSLSFPSSIFLALPLDKPALSLYPRLSLSLLPFLGTLHPARSTSRSPIRLSYLKTLPLLFSFFILFPSWLPPFPYTLHPS